MSNVRAGGAFVEVSLRDNLTSRLKNIENSVSNFGANVARIGSAVTAIGASITAPIALATRVFVGFDDKVRLSGSIVQAQGARYESLRQRIADLGRTTSFTADQVAGASVELARAFGAGGSLEVEATLQPVLNLDRATGTNDLATTAGILARTLNSFQIDTTNFDEVTRVANDLGFAANNSSTDLVGLFEALKFVSRTAVDAGIPLEDLLGTLGVLANLGLEGTLGGTGLRKSILQLTNDVNRERLTARFGIEIDDDDLASFPQTLASIGQAAEGLSNVERLSLFRDLFGLTAVTSASAISQSLKEIQSLSAGVGNSGGFIERISEFADSGVGGAIRFIISAVEGLGNAFTLSLEAPIVAFSVQIREAIARLIQFAETNAGFVRTLAGAGLAITGVGISLTVLGVGIIAAASVFGIFASLLGTVVSLVSLAIAPIGVFTAGIVGITGGFATLGAAGARFTSFLTTLVSDVRTVAGEIGSAFQVGDFDLGADLAAAAIEDAIGGAVRTVQSLWSEMVDRVTTITGRIRPVIEQFFQNPIVSTGLKILGVAVALNILSRAVLATAGLFRVFTLAAAFFTPLRTVTILTASAFGRVLRPVIAITSLTLLAFSRVVLFTALSALPALIVSIANAGRALIGFVGGGGIASAFTGIVSAIGGLGRAFTLVAGRAALLLGSFISLSRTNGFFVTLGRFALGFAGTIGTAFAGLGATLLAPFAGLLAPITGILSAAGAAVIAFLGTFSTPVLVVGGIVAGFVAIAASLLGFTQAGRTAWSAFIEFMSNSISLVADGFGLFLDGLPGPIGRALRTFGSLFTGLLGVIGSVFTTIGSLIVSPFRLLQPFAASALFGVLDLFEGIGSAIGSTFLSLVGTIGEHLASIGTAIRDTFADSIEFVSGLFSDLGRTIGQSFGGISTALSNFDFRGAFDIGVAGIHVAFAQLIRDLGGLWSAFTGGFVNAWDAAVTTAISIQNRIENAIAGIVLSPEQRVILQEDQDRARNRRAEANQRRQNSFFTGFQESQDEVDRLQAKLDGLIEAQNELAENGSNNPLGSFLGGSLFEGALNDAAVNLDVQAFADIASLIGADIPNPSGDDGILDVIESIFKTGDANKTGLAEIVNSVDGVRDSITDPSPSFSPNSGTSIVGNDEADVTTEFENIVTGFRDLGQVINEEIDVRRRANTSLEGFFGFVTAAGSRDNSSPRAGNIEIENLLRELPQVIAQDRSNGVLISKEAFDSITVTETEGVNIPRDAFDSITVPEIEGVNIPRDAFDSITVSEIEGVNIPRDAFDSITNQIPSSIVLEQPLPSFRPSELFEDIDGLFFGGIEVTPALPSAPTINTEDFYRDIEGLFFTSIRPAEVGPTADSETGGSEELVNLIRSQNESNRLMQEMVRLQGDTNLGLTGIQDTIRQSPGQTFGR